MKSIIFVALALAAVAIAAPTSENVYPKVLRSEFDQKPEGGYNFGFETEDGINRSENGELKQVPDEENKPQTVVVVRGSYSYPGEDGKPVVVEYYADETGFHAEGETIPKPSRR